MHNELIKDKPNINTYIQYDRNKFETRLVRQPTEGSLEENREWFGIQFDFNDFFSWLFK